MKALLQRVSRAEVRVGGATVGAISSGYVALLGIEVGDTERDANDMVRKIIGLRLFNDADGKMNLPLGERSVLVISQFTLCADVRRGMRPSFDRAAPPAEAEVLYRTVVEKLKTQAVHVATGVFRADMQVELINDGPVTILVSSRSEAPANDCGAE